LPLSQFIAAVQFGPDGLQLDAPATLTIHAPAGVDLAGGIGFVFDGSGKNLQLVPANVQGSTITLQVNHFSTMGYAAGSPEDVLASELLTLQNLVTNHVPSAAETAATQAVLANKDPVFDALTLSQYFTTTVQPGLEAAQTDANKLPGALAEYNAWLAVPQRVGIAPPGIMNTEDSLAKQLALVGVNNAIDQAYRHTDDFTRPPLLTPIVPFWVQKAIELNLDEVGFIPSEQLKKTQSIRTTIVAITPPASIEPGHAAQVRIQAGYTVGGVLHLGPAALYQDTGQRSDWENPPTVDPPLRVTFNLVGATQSSIQADSQGNGVYTADVTLADNSTQITGTVKATYIPTESQGVDIFDRKPISIQAAKLTLQARYPTDAPGVSRTDVCAANDGNAHLTAALTLLNGGSPVPLKPIQFSLTGGGSLDANTVTTGQQGQAEVNFTAPHDGTGVSTVTATLGTGAGAPSNSVDIHYGPAVTVTPVLAALNPGGTAQFSADVCGSADKTVTWTATGGTIDNTGLFTAGSTAGNNFAVTATSVADTSKRAQANVQVARSTQGIVGTWQGTEQLAVFDAHGWTDTAAGAISLVFPPDMGSATVTLSTPSATRAGVDPKFLANFVDSVSGQYSGSGTVNSFDGQKSLDPFTRWLLSAVEGGNSPVTRGVGGSLSYVSYGVNYYRITFSAAGV
jgi:hypothetical protein